MMMIPILEKLLLCSDMIDYDRSASIHQFRRAGGRASTAP
jgi:hypothetical protein